MDEKIETSRGVARLAGGAGAPLRRHWVARNERFLRTICMICAYVCGAVCLVSIFALGAFAFISGVLAGITLVAVLAALLLLKFREKRPPGGAAMR